MPKIDTLLKWLNANLNSDLVIEAWLYGSILKKKQCNDIDVFIKYRDGFETSIPKLKREIEIAFDANFNIPLDLLFLSQSECAEAKAFLHIALTSAHRII